MSNVSARVDTMDGSNKTEKCCIGYQLTAIKYFTGAKQQNHIFSYSFGNHDPARNQRTCISASTTIFYAKSTTIHG